MGILNIKRTLTCSFKKYCAQRFKTG